MSAASSAAAKPRALTSASTGQLMLAWLAVIVMFQGLSWLNGSRSYALAVAVDQGAARTEQNLRGEVNDDDALKAILLQTDTLTFWAVLAMLFDLLLEPAWIVLRPFLAAVVVASAAAVAGRKPPFSAALRRFTLLQVLWLIGPAVAGVLSWSLGQPADASCRLFLPPGEYPAMVWILLGKIDCLGLLGWLAFVGATWRHRWAPIWLAIPGLGMLWLFELGSRSIFELLLETGMRLTIIPS